MLADKLLATLSDVRTFAAPGFADANVASWHVIAVRAATPVPMVERVHASAMKALQEPASWCRKPESRAKPDTELTPRP